MIPKTIATEENGREYVRGKVRLEINYRIISREEFEERTDTGMTLESPKMWNAIGSSHQAEADNDSLVAFLRHLDAKLDKILNLVAKDHKEEKAYYEAIGLNISGSGLKMITEHKAAVGQIVHLNFALSHKPFYFIDTCGEVVNVEPDTDSTATRYRMGIRFLDLTSRDQEQIIAAVFQRERKAIRRQKNEEEAQEAD
jgi:hypothetical protein